jgi:type II secretory pathway component PulF
MTRTIKPGIVKPRSKLAIAALIVPSVLFLISLVMLAVINLIFNPTFWMVGDTEPVNPTPFVITVLNIFFLLTGGVGLISLVPGMIIGALLLIRSKRNRKSEPN